MLLDFQKVRAKINISSNSRFSNTNNENYLRLKSAYWDDTNKCFIVEASLSTGTSIEEWVILSNRLFSQMKPSGDYIMAADGVVDFLAKANETYRENLFACPAVTISYDPAPYYYTVITSGLGVLTNNCIFGFNWRGRCVLRFGIAGYNKSPMCKFNLPYFFVVNDAYASADNKFRKVVAKAGGLVKVISDGKLMRPVAVAGAVEKWNVGSLNGVKLLGIDSSDNSYVSNGDWLKKYNSSGTLQWTVNFDSVSDIATMDDGTTFVAGTGCDGVVNAASEWVTSHSYSVGDFCKIQDDDLNWHFFVCKSAHTSSSANRPLTGASWETYWKYATCIAWVVNSSGTITGRVYEVDYYDYETANGYRVDVDVNGWFGLAVNYDSSYDYMYFDDTVANVWSLTDYRVNHLSIGATEATYYDYHYVIKDSRYLKKLDNSDGGEEWSVDLGASVTGLAIDVDRDDDNNVYIVTYDATNGCKLQKRDKDDGSLIWEKKVLLKSTTESNVFAKKGLILIS